MPARRPPRQPGKRPILPAWYALWAASFLLALGVLVLYTWLPADGATGDLESFRPEGFRVQWLLEERSGGLRVGDLIVRAGGHSAQEWLRGAPPGPEWRAGRVVPYEILRAGRPMTLDIRLAPIPFRAILARWALQSVVALAFLFVGVFVFWKRPQDLAARLLALFCILMTLQYLGDAYNFQYATLPWRWPFWLHLAYEQGMYGLALSTISYFALVFPAPHPLVERFPRLTPFVLYAAFPLAILGAMALSSDWTAALRNGNHASWLVAMAELAMAVLAGIRSLRVSRDPVTRTQIRWIVWCTVVGCGILIPGYVLPLMITGRAPLPHPVTMLVNALIPFTLAIAVLRYRLFDIEVIINRTLVYATLTALLAGLYLLIVRVLTLVFEIGWQGENSTLVVFVATLIVALAFDPLRRRVQHLIDLAFYRTKLDYQRLLPEMSERLATSIVLDELATLLTDQVPRRVQIAWATLAVLDPQGVHLVPAAGGDGTVLPADHALAAYLHRSGQPLLRLHSPADLPHEARAFLDRHRIELSLPLIVGQQLVGLYNLGLKQSGDTYTRDEVRLLHLLGQQAAVAVENSRLFQAERQQRELVEALQEAADAVSSTLDLDQVLDRILEQVERVVAGDAFNIMLVEGDVAEVVRWRGYEPLGADQAIASLRMPLAQYPALARMMHTGKAIVIPNTAQDPNWVPMKGWEWQRSYVSAPIQVAGQTVGFLNVDRTQPAQPGQADAQRLEAFAHQAATALENARLYAETQRQLREQTALREAGAIISSTLDPETVLARIAEAMGRAVDATSAYISDYEPATMMASVLAEWIGPEACAEERPSDLGAAYMEDGEVEWLEMMQAGQHDISHVDSPNITAFERVHMQQYGAKSILYIPLRIKGRFVGYAELWESRRRREFTPAEIALCHDIAHQAAIALENARLYAETQRQLQEQTALREAGAIISSTLDPVTVLARIAEAMGQAVDATGAYISSYEPTTGMSSVLAEYVGPGACAAEQVSDLGATYAEDAGPEWLEMLQAGQHDITHIDGPDLTLFERTHMQQYGVKTILYIPLRIKGQLVGYAELWESRRRQEFTPAEIALCQDIAQQAAVALENARLYEQAQLEIAERKRAEEQIKASLTEKEVLLKEIHHRVKNNLQVISSLLYLQSKQIEDEETLAMFQDSQYRVRSMALVHEKLYQTEDLARVDAAGYVQTLVNYLFRAYRAPSGCVRLTIHVDDVPLGIDAAVPCGLLINELVSNSLKHAFPDAREGETTVELRATEEGQYVLVIGDDGVGFPDDLDFRTTKSLGLQLVNTLVDQLEGSITLDTSAGTRFEITFPGPWSSERRP